MKVREYTSTDRDVLVALIADYRVALSSVRGREREIDLDAAAAELREYVDRGYPVFVAEADPGKDVGYLVCRTDGSAVWVESLFVLPDYRRRGIGARLYEAAEQYARAGGEPTLYNWVHPDNDAIIALLKRRGYDVLNLIEIRRPLPGEDRQATLRIGDHDYRY